MKTKKLLCLVLSLLMLSAVSCQKDDTEVVYPEEVTENTLDEPQNESEETYPEESPAAHDLPQNEPEDVVNMVLHNVKDYGAVGDNKTDDTEAFKKAVSEAEKDGLPVYVPAGTYIISDTITLKSVTLYGYKSGAWTADD